MRALNWHLHAPDSLRPRKLAELMAAPPEAEQPPPPPLVAHDLSQVTSPPPPERRSVVMLCGGAPQPACPDLHARSARPTICTPNHLHAQPSAWS